MGVLAVWVWSQQFQSPMFLGTQPAYATKALINHNLFLEPEWAIDSEAMRARGIIVLVKSN